MRRRLTIGASLILFALVAAPSTAVAIEWMPVPPEVKPAPWEPSPVTKRVSPVWDGSFHLQVEGGYCLGEEPPHIDHVRVVERPKTSEHPFSSAVVTVFEYFPEHEAPVRTEAEETVAVCFGIGRELMAAVKFKRPLDHLFIYDGSRSLPKRMWPPVGY